MRAAVVGLGKIGLPLAVQIAGRGIPTVGADINPDVVAMINAGTPPFPGEAELDDRLRDVLATGMFEATTSTGYAVASADVTVVVVPLVVDDSGTPDFRAIDSATAAIGGGLRPGHLVVYETTLPIGTTRGRLGPILEEVSSLKPGMGFYLAFSPERVSSGRVFRDLRSYPKLVGGVNEASTEAAIRFYDQALEFDERPDLMRLNGVWDLGSCEAAEMAKLAETTYRDVNIGLANQFARFADQSGIDLYAVIEACNSQPYSHIHQPGIAVGGHCIPVYPRLYLHNDPNATIVRAAREVNARMPEYAVRRLEEEYGDLTGAKVAVLGASYRGGVKETAFSGVFPVVDALRERGARVLVHDPMFSDAELMEFGWEPYHQGEPADAAIIQADHAEYREFVLPATVIVDGRRTWTSRSHRIITLGGGGV